MTYRVAVLGAGRISGDHFRAIEKLETLRAVAVADVLEDRVNEVAENYGVTAYLDYKEMIDVEQPDIAIIALPPFMHKEAAVYCASKGCHLLLEKPMALNVKECEEIIAAAGKYGVKLMIGHTMHYMPAPMKVKELIEQSSLGELVMINDTRHTFYYGEDRLDWFFQKETAGGGILFNLGSHSIDKVLWFTESNITSIKSALSYKGLKGNIEGAGLVFAQTGAGVPATISQSGYEGVPRNETELIFTKGMIRLSYEVWISKGKEYFQVPLDDSDDPFVLQLKDLLKSIETGKPLVCSGEYGKSVIQAIEAIYQSHDLGIDVVLDMRGASL
jgi:predicted dehydrogenase